MSSNPISGIVSALLPQSASDVLLDAALPGARQLLGLAGAVGGSAKGKETGALATALGGADSPARAKAPAPRTAARTRATPKSTTSASTRTAGRRTSPARSTRARRTCGGSATASRKATTGYAASSAKGDFAFLRDPKLSVEEKLMKFMAVMAKKLDEDMVGKMEEMTPDGSRTSSASGSSSGTKKAASGGSASRTAPAPAAQDGAGALSSLGGALSGFLNDKTFGPLLKQASGPVLAAGASAMGFPAAAPFLLQAGPKIFDFAAGAARKLDGGSGATSSGSSKASSSSSSSGTSRSSSAASGAIDSSQEKLKMMELQALMDKQKEMMSLVSNMLRSMHDMRMACINNMR